FSRRSTGLLHDEFIMGLLPDDAQSAQAPCRPVSVANAERYRWGGESDGWRLVKSPGLSVIEERMPPGAREERHRHLLSRQFFRVLSGELTLEVDGERMVLREGEGLEIPPGAAHQALNTGDIDTRFLVISTPPSHGDR